jgi:hypothetical protein
MTSAGGPRAAAPAARGSAVPAPAARRIASTPGVGGAP